MPPGTSWIFVAICLFDAVAFAFVGRSMAARGKRAIGGGFLLWAGLSLVMAPLYLIPSLPMGAAIGLLIAHSVIGSGLVAAGQAKDARPPVEPARTPESKPPVR